MSRFFSKPEDAAKYTQDAERKKKWIKNALPGKIIIQNWKIIVSKKSKS